MGSASEVIDQHLARAAVREVRAMTAGLLEDRAAQVKRIYPTLLLDCAERLPEHASDLNRAAQLLREASELLRVAEGVLFGVLGKLETARRGEAGEPAGESVVH
jgi:hypothetical protein